MDHCKPSVLTRVVFNTPNPAPTPHHQEAHPDSTGKDTPTVAGTFSSSYIIRRHVLYYIVHRITFYTIFSYLYTKYICGPVHTHTHTHTHMYNFVTSAVFPYHYFPRENDLGLHLVVLAPGGTWLIERAHSVQGDSIKDLSLLLWL